jgi:hypothetical protein
MKYSNPNLGLNFRPWQSQIAIEYEQVFSLKISSFHFKSRNHSYLSYSDPCQDSSQIFNPTPNAVTENWEQADR